MTEKNQESTQTKQKWAASSSDPSWLYGKNITFEEQERRRRESRVQRLLTEDEDDVIGRAYDSRLTARLLDFMKPYRTRLYAAVALMVVSAVLSVSIPWIIGRAVDAGIRTRDMQTLRMWTVLLLVAAVGAWLFDRTRIRIMAYVGTKVVTDMRSALFSHLHQLSLAFHTNYSVGRLMSRLISDVGVLQDFVTWSITGLARSFFILIGIIGVMLWMDWKLALVTFSVVPLMILLTNYWRKRVRAAYRATRQRLSLINGFLNESITGIRVTKSFTREQENALYFDDLNRAYFDANVDATRLAAIFFPGVDFMGSLATALVVGVGGWLVLDDALTAGTLVAFILYVERFFDPIRELAQRYNTFQATMAASERIFNLIDTEPDLIDEHDAIPLPPVTGNVDFDHVSFAYKDGEPVLQDVDLHAAPGQRIALVGETGAGKSTVIRLLARFFDVTDGSVRIDGYDLRNVRMSSLRSQLGIVLQDTFLFGGSIGDNIRYGRLDASEDEVIEAAKAVGAHDFIISQPGGYDADVGEDGVNLSVGQRQLISFARALLADPRILILDEATSSIDTATEKVIQAALEQLMQDRTSFVIAHRLSTIVNSDKIVVMDQGQIVEEGTHEDLLEQKGRYYNLYTMQWAQDEPQYSLN